MSQSYMPVSPLTEDYGTPPEVFDPLNEEFGFTLDVAASDRFHLCEKYFTIEEDGLEQSWEGHTCWCNPPYNVKDLWAFSKKAVMSAKIYGTTTVLYVPPKTDQKWWSFLWNLYKNDPEMDIDFRFQRGRTKFVHKEVLKKRVVWRKGVLYLPTHRIVKDESSPFPSVAIVVRRRNA